MRHSLALAVGKQYLEVLLAVYGARLAACGAAGPANQLLRVKSTACSVACTQVVVESDQESNRGG